MCFFMFGVSLKATNSSLQKRLTFSCSIYVKKVIKLVAFIFEHPHTSIKRNRLHKVLFCLA